MKLSLKNTATDTDMKSISVSHANAIWDEANLSITTKLSSHPGKEEPETYSHTVKESYSFVTEWTFHNNNEVKPKYEYKENDFIVEW